MSLRQIVIGSLLLLLAMLAVVAEAGLVATVVPPGSVLAMPTPEAAEQTEVAYIAERTAMTDVCSGPSFQRDVCADLATRVALAPTQVVARGTNTRDQQAVCAGYDARLPLPDACPPATPAPERR